MSWSERQRRMLEAMGLKIWVPPSVATDVTAAGGERAAAHGSAPAVHREAAGAGEASAGVAVAERPRASIDADAAPPATRPTAPAARPPVERPRAAPPTDRSPAPAPQRVAEVLARALPGAGRDPLADATGAPAGNDVHPAREGLSREAIAALDWDGLRSAVADCRACGLCESRKNTVFGVGHSQAHWMIIGEAPGEQEDLQGEPFVGPAGKLLDSMLRSLGLSRSEGPPEQQVFIANTLKCRPPRNRNPDPAELAQCEPFLQRQIELIQPRIILAMGRFAVQQLLQSQEAIGRLRGRVHRYQGVPLVVTYHPAYLLRNLPDKARAWEDLCLARQTLEAGG
ncbi:uracil-DNA glycosylase [Roseateles terrae]|uniref:Type-4 uracil-DNA glycosylase n=1 Tax=Roseateles terrae TaxID=431060 RepID=A0ABR6GS25_9BURK|nr:uracil-DNA glycosylase [Roseateles terrae]MBB3194502.1 DNA polymerase [Roseateles terrae]OWQ83487.1 hypothetical protein CDN98_22540 [Roseateles terrae]